MESKQSMDNSSDEDVSPIKTLGRKRSFKEEFNFSTMRGNANSTFLPQARSGNLSLFEATRRPVHTDSLHGIGMAGTISVSNVSVPYNLQLVVDKI